MTKPAGSVHVEVMRIVNAYLNGRGGIIEFNQSNNPMGFSMVLNAPSITCHGSGAIIRDMEQNGRYDVGKIYIEFDKNKCF